MKGDSKVIDHLNAGLRAELTGISQFWLHYRLLEDWGYGHLAAAARRESLGEMNRVDSIIARIIFLEGHPKLQKLDPLRIGENVKEVLDADLAAGHHSRDIFIKGREYCDEVADYVSRALFDDLIADEEEHIDFLETQAALHDRLGDERYGLLNASPADTEK